MKPELCALASSVSFGSLLVYHLVTNLREGNTSVPSICVPLITGTCTYLSVEMDGREANAG